MSLIIRDDCGREVFLSQGIGGYDSPWGAYRRKPSGSLQRIKSIPLAKSRAVAGKRLRDYAEAHKGWSLEYRPELPMPKENS